MTNSKMRWKAEAEIIAKYGTMSTRKIAAKLKEEYGITVSHITVGKDLKLDLSALSFEDIDNKKSHILDTLEELATIAFNMAKTDDDSSVKLRAMDTYRKLMESRGTILTKFEQAKMQMQDIDKPVYNIFVGEPREADLSRIKKIQKEEKEAKEDVE